MSTFWKTFVLGTLLLAACNKNEQSEPADTCVLNNSPYLLHYFGLDGGRFGPRQLGGNQFCQQLEPGALWSWRVDYVTADASFTFASWQGDFTVEAGSSNSFAFTGQPDLQTFDFRDNGLIGNLPLTCTCVEVTAAGDTVATTTEAVVASVTKSPTRVDQVEIDAGTHYTGPGVFHGEPLFDLPNNGAGKGFFLAPNRFELYTVKDLPGSSKQYCTCK